MMDQALVNDAINAAASSQGSAHDWPSTYVTGASNHKHAFWQEHDRGKRSERAKGQAWYASAWSYSDERYAAPITFSGMKPEAQWQAFHSAKLENVQLKYMPLRIPLDALDEHGKLIPIDTIETFAAAPQWTFGNAEMESYNWPVVAVTHLVAASADWGDDHGWTHAGRRALMAAAGAWQGAQTYQVRTVQQNLPNTRADYYGLFCRFCRAGVATEGCHLVKRSGASRVVKGQ
jgi:hypothetical protein